MPINRRSLIRAAALAPALGAMGGVARGAPGEGKADYTLRIANGLVELAPDHIL